MEESKYGKLIGMAVVLGLILVVGCAAASSSLYSVDESEYGLELRSPRGGAQRAHVSRPVREGAVHRHGSVH